MSYEEVKNELKDLPDAISKKNGILYSKATWWKEHWNKDYYLRYSIETGLPYQKIMSKFLQLKGTAIDNYEQAIFFYTRNQSIASKMSGFSLEKIEKVYNYLKAKIGDYRIALETIGKYLEEDLDLLNGQEPIIILTNGEKVYELNRLKELESNGIICWRNNKWFQQKNI
jgi:hypothetical protein